MIITSHEIEKLIKGVTEDIARRLGDNLEALILVGSFARGEGIETLSDIELLAIVKNVKIVPNSEAIKNITIKFTTSKHLERLKPYIFTIELKKYGKVFWGDKDILRLVPDYSYADIEPKDGWTLLNNRIVEQLMVWREASSHQPVRYYDIVKGYIQLVNAYLAVNRRYKSLYPEKEEEFNRVYNGNGSLKNKVSEAFSFLKEPENRILALDEALRQWNELRDYYRQLWQEQSRIFAKPPSFLERIKGWIKVLSDSKKRTFFSFSEIIRNLLTNSHQSLIYKAAVNEYFADNPNTAKVNQLIKQWEVVVK